MMLGARHFGDGICHAVGAALTVPSLLIKATPLTSSACHGLLLPTERSTARSYNTHVTTPALHLLTAFNSHTQTRCCRTCPLSIVDEGIVASNLGMRACGA